MLYNVLIYNSTVYPAILCSYLMSVMLQVTIALISRWVSQMNVLKVMRVMSCKTSTRVVAADMTNVLIHIL